MMMISSVCRSFLGQEVEDRGADGNEWGRLVEALVLFDGSHCS